VVALESHTVGGVLDRHRRVPGQQLDHHALMRRIEMLDQDEGHAAVGRQRVEEILEGLETAGRGADPDHREIPLSRRGGACQRWPSAGPPPRRFARVSCHRSRILCRRFRSLESFASGHLRGGWSDPAAADICPARYSIMFAGFFLNVRTTEIN
jgi:hypothetical protein